MKLTVKDLAQKRIAGEKIVMLTAYDFPTAAIEDQCGVDVQLIGDSVGTNVLGYADVSEVTVEDIAHHVRAVARGARRSFVLADMPYHSFASKELALQNARRFVSAGADGVKMEGELEAVEQVRHLAANQIPVCAHIGYTPQTDGTRAAVQGKDAARARELIDAAAAVEDAGAFMLVLELVPERLAEFITARLSIPTISIGSGRYCSGQVQVVHDILGLSERLFRHAKAFGALREESLRAVGRYVDEVRTGAFPTEKNAASLPDEVFETVVQWADHERRLRPRTGGR
jgi:3-methyl-2-oxobutanoate hydroxymethyltransferase